MRFQIVASRQQPRAEIASSRHSRTVPATSHMLPQHTWLRQLLQSLLAIQAAHMRCAHPVRVAPGRATARIQLRLPVHTHTPAQSVAATPSRHRPHHPSIAQQLGPTASGFAAARPETHRPGTRAGPRQNTHHRTSATRVHQCPQNSHPPPHIPGKPMSLHSLGALRGRLYYTHDQSGPAAHHARDTPPPGRVYISDDLVVSLPNTPGLSFSHLA